MITLESPHQSLMHTQLSNGSTSLSKLKSLVLFILQTWSSIFVKSNRIQSFVLSELISNELVLILMDLDTKIQLIHPSVETVSSNFGLVICQNYLISQYNHWFSISTSCHSISSRTCVQQLMQLCTRVWFIFTKIILILRSSIIRT